MKLFTKNIKSCKGECEHRFMNCCFHDNVISKKGIGKEIDADIVNKFPFWCPLDDVLKISRRNKLKKLNETKKPD